MVGLARGLQPVQCSVDRRALSCRQDRVVVGGYRLSALQTGRYKKGRSIM